MIRLSVILPTYNRCKFLVQCLQSLINQSIDKKLYEVIVIDNNSTDNTCNVIKNYLEKSSIKWQYLLEKRPGVHNARNLGFTQAKGDIIVFGDDDIITPNDWLERILKEFDNNPKLGLVGGKVLPLFEKTPPAWIYDYGSKKVHSILASLDYGDKDKLLDKDYLYSNNMAARKDLILKTGGNAPCAFPPKFKKFSGSGEGFIIDNIRNLSYEVLYVPAIFVQHHVSSFRMNLNYFIDRYERLAVEEAFIIYRKHKKIKASFMLIY
ncbi:glycosyltransferase family 2 protein [Candidatus Dependentiae bacterium]